MKHQPESVIRNTSGKDGTPRNKKRSPSTATQDEILGAMQELYALHQVVTRDALATATGYKLHILDDHLGKLVEQGRASRVRAGVYVPVIEWGEPRAVSVTHLHGGLSKIEIGDEVLQLHPAERRMLASLLVGDAVQYSNMQAGHDANLLANELYTALRMLRRQETRGGQRNPTAATQLPSMSAAAVHLAEQFAEQGHGTA
ncbi:hypothetical protein [Comamonas sp. 26]|uniref:hypothetical protein n=1 Tax=Comamonas sp. 26 TaxID=2035201 RepID=UPI000C1905D7|nr:hypothetical protein [Comamonas sp. 26]PIG09481.1 hypothetical protein CLU84_2392 [Comamonas sp. 26]